MSAAAAAAAAHDLTPEEKQSLFQQGSRPLRNQVPLPVSQSSPSTGYGAQYYDDGDRILTRDVYMPNPRPVDEFFVPPRPLSTEEFQFRRFAERVAGHSNLSLSTIWHYPIDPERPIDDLTQRFGMQQGTRARADFNHVGPRTRGQQLGSDEEEEEKKDEEDEEAEEEEEEEDEDEEELTYAQRQLRKQWRERDEAGVEIPSASGRSARQRARENDQQMPEDVDDDGDVSDSDKRAKAERAERAKIEKAAREKRNKEEKEAKKAAQEEARRRRSFHRNRTRAVFVSDDDDDLNDDDRISPYELSKASLRRKRRGQVHSFRPDLDRGVNADLSVVEANHLKFLERASPCMTPRLAASLSAVLTLIRNLDNPISKELSADQLAYHIRYSDYFSMWVACNLATESMVANDEWKRAEVFGIVNTRAHLCRRFFEGLTRK